MLGKALHRFSFSCNEGGGSLMDKLALLIPIAAVGGILAYALNRPRSTPQGNAILPQSPVAQKGTPTSVTSEEEVNEQPRPWENVPLPEDTVNFTGPIPDVPKSSAAACEEFVQKNYGPNWREFFRKRIEEYPWRSKKGKRNALSILDSMCRKGTLWDVALANLTNLAQIDRAAYYDEVAEEARTLQNDLYHAVLRLENPGFYNTTYSVAESLAADVILRARQAGFGPCIFSWEYQGRSMPTLQPYYQRALDTYWPDGNFDACGVHDLFKDIERVTLQRWGSK